MKAALLQQLRAGGNKPVKPAEVEAAYSRLLKNREMQRNLAELAQTRFRRSNTSRWTFATRPDSAV